MEARCYTGGENRTRMKELKYTKNDFYTYLYIVFMIIFVVVTNILYTKGII